MLMGENGAGKSTLMKCIAGVLRPSNGHVALNGEVLPPRAHEVVKRRMVLVPEGRWIFPGLTIEENLEIGAYTVSSTAEGKERAFSMFPKLKERRRQRLEHSRERTADASHCKRTHGQSGDYHAG